MKKVYKGYEIMWNEYLHCYNVFCGWDGTLCFDSIEDAKEEIDLRAKNREAYEAILKNQQYPRMF